jgi:hypothetical protein
LVLLLLLLLPILPLLASALGFEIGAWFVTGVVEQKFD